MKIGRILLDIAIIIVSVFAIVISIKDIVEE